MRVLLVSMNFAPELTGIGRYSGEMARALVEAGHEVHVVCAPPYYPQWKLGEGASRWRWQVQRPLPGLTVWRCPLWVPSRPGGLKRVLHLLSFALSALPVTLAQAAWRPGVVLAVAPAFFAAPAAWLAARLCGAVAWLHVQDFELDAAFGLGLLRGGLLRRLAAAAERRLLARFDRVSTLSRGMQQLLVAKGVAPERTALLPNGVDLAAIRPAEQGSAWRAELGLAPEQVVFLFAGTMNRKQGLPLLFDALDRLPGRDDIVLVLCGQGELRAALERRAAGRANVRLLPLQPAERLNELLNLADVHVLPQLPGAAELVMPSKLGGMLASGRPVIAGAQPGTEIAGAVAGCGRVVPPDDAAAFAQAMAELAADAALRRALGAAARERAEQAFGQGAVMARLECLLQVRGAEGEAAQPAAAPGEVNAA